MFCVVVILWVNEHFACLIHFTFDQVTFGKFVAAFSVGFLGKNHRIKTCKTQAVKLIVLKV
jgi:hypothetical protein